MKQSQALLVSVYAAPIYTKADPVHFSSCEVYVLLACGPQQKS